MEQHYQIIRRLDEIIWQNREILKLIKDPSSSKFTFKITQENAMSAGNPIIVQGTPAGFVATLLQAGTPYVPPTGSSYILQCTWSADDTDLVLTPSTDTLSVSVSDPTSDISTTATLGVSAVAPDGSLAVGSLVVTLQPGTVSNFSFNIAPAAAPVSGNVRRTFVR